MTEFDVDMASKPAPAATDPNGPTGRLATWLADTKLDVPPSVRDQLEGNGFELSVPRQRRDLWPRGPPRER
jgi:hypothetical protein